MDAKKQVEQDSASQASKSDGEAYCGAVTNPDTHEDQLSHFMTRAMALQQSSSAPKVGSFVGFTPRFNGTASEVKNFIASVILYKDMEGIKDETALQELSSLLEGEAATWWAEMKTDVHIWSEALKLLERKFLVRRQAYQIYHEIFSVKQDDHIPTEIFIKQKRALFDELPQTYSEEVQIDMIYSLLSSKIQKRVARETIVTFDQLIRAAHRVEHSKYKKRLRRFEGPDLNPSTSAEKPTKLCSHYREFDEWGRNREVDCYKCRHKRRKCVEGYSYTVLTPDTSRNSLRDFKPYLTAIRQFTPPPTDK